MNSTPWTVRGARRRWPALALSLVFSLPALAATAEPPSLSLRQAVDAALARLPETAAAPERRQAAQAQLRAAGHWTPEPASLELSYKSDRAQSNRGERELVAGIAAPLWLPGERDRTRALAESEQRAVDSRLDAAQWRAVAAVREAWWAVQAADQALRVVQARASQASQLADDVAKRVRAGDLARADQHQADGLRAAAEAEMAQGHAARTRAAHALRALTGAAVPALASAAEPLPQRDTEAALAAHPLLRELAAKAEVARRTRELAGVQTRANPELTLATARERGGTGEAYGQSLTVGLRIPFGSSDRNAARLGAASAEQTEAEIQLALERERVVDEIASAQQQVTSARLARDAAERRAVLSRETLGFYEKSFRLGETDLPNRLRVALEVFEAEQQSAAAQVALALAVSQWRQALGLLPE